jgi:hypothetical protein
MTERKLDIFRLLNAADRRDVDYLAKQQEDARKEFAPLVAMRWAVTVNDGPEADYMLLMVNERVNAHLFDLYQHPGLSYKLLASGGIGAPLRHNWLAGHKRKTDNNKAYQFLSERFPDANDSELEMLMNTFDKKGLRDFIDDCGLQPAESKEIMKAYDKLTERAEA